MHIIWMRKQPGLWSELETSSRIFTEYAMVGYELLWQSINNCSHHICLRSRINKCLNKHSLNAWYYEVGVFTTTGSHKYHCKFPTSSFYNRFKGYSRAEIILNQPVPRSSSRTKRGHLVLNNPWRGYWPDVAGYLSTFIQTRVLLMH